MASSFCLGQTVPRVICFQWDGILRRLLKHDHSGDTDMRDKRSGNYDT